MSDIFKFINFYKSASQRQTRRIRRKRRCFLIPGFPRNFLSKQLTSLGRRDIQSTNKRKKKRKKKKKRKSEFFPSFSIFTNTTTSCKVANVSTREGSNGYSKIYSALRREITANFACIKRGNRAPNSKKHSRTLSILAPASIPVYSPINAD